MLFEVDLKVAVAFKPEPLTVNVELIGEPLNDSSLNVQLICRKAEGVMSFVRTPHQETLPLLSV